MNNPHTKKRTAYCDSNEIKKGFSFLVVHTCQQYCTALMHLIGSLHSIQNKIFAVYERVIAVIYFM